jgi:hypothetical protein
MNLSFLLPAFLRPAFSKRNRRRPYTTPEKIVLFLAISAMESRRAARRMRKEGWENGARQFRIQSDTYLHAARVARHIEEI